VDESKIIENKSPQLLNNTAATLDNTLDLNEEMLEKVSTGSCGTESPHPCAPRLDAHDFLPMLTRLLNNTGHLDKHIMKRLHKDPEGLMRQVFKIPKSSGAIQQTKIRKLVVYGRGRSK
jgi:hypothetical protein